MDPCDDEAWLSSWEQQCVNAIESQTDIEKEYENEQEACRSFIFGNFQDSARSVGHLYAAKKSPDGDEPGALWTAFQMAAGSVTTLYRASVEGFRRSGEAGMALGHARRTRDLLSWARRHRRPVIRRDDLLAYLAGKPPPPTATRAHRSSPRPRPVSPVPETDTHHNTASEADLDMFREALAPSSRNQCRTLPKPTGGSSNSEQLCAFIAAEIARHRKRPAPSSSPNDVNMDSPTPHYNSKRQRFM